MARLIRARLVAEAGPPRSPSAYFEWSPKLCFDDACFAIERLGRLLLYYPASNILVEVWAENQEADPYYFLPRR